MGAAALFLLMLFAVPSLAFDLEGHRGTRGLAPENTLAAFRRAYYSAFEDLVALA